MWVTYITIYKGNKLPPFYIGSTKLSRINRGYKGSVKSKEYMDIWKKELKENNHLFTTKIITQHIEKNEALKKEEYFQKYFSVHKNTLYINKNISGKYFTREPGYKLTEEHKKKIGLANSKALLGKKLTKEHKEKLKKRKHTEETKKKMSAAHKGHKRNLGIKLTKEHKEKLKGKIPWNKGKTGEGMPNYGKVFTEEHKRKISIGVSKGLQGNNCRSKYYTITYPDGKVDKIFNLKKFCLVKNWPYKYVNSIVGKNQKYENCLIKGINNGING